MSWQELLNEILKALQGSAHWIGIFVYFAWLTWFKTTQLRQARSDAYQSMLSINYVFDDNLQLALAAFDKIADDDTLGSTAYIMLKSCQHIAAFDVLCTRFLQKTCCPADYLTLRRRFLKN